MGAGAVPQAREPAGLRAPGRGPGRSLAVAAREVRLVLAAYTVDSPQENACGYGARVSEATIFAYVGGNPVSRTDATGLYWFQQPWQSTNPLVGRADTLVPPGGPISSAIEKYVPAGRTLGEVHDPLVDALTRAGVPDVLANVPTMPSAYAGAVGLEILRTFGIIKQPAPTCPR